MLATELQVSTLLEALRPYCTNHEQKADLRIGVDMLNGLRAKYYWDSPAKDLEVKEINKSTVTKALMNEDSLCVEWMIGELDK